MEFERALQDGRNQPNPYPFWERIGRLVWVFTYFVLYRPVPRIFGFWHRFILRLFGARLGTGVKIYPSARIYFPWRLILEDYCVVGDKVNLYSLGYIRVGRHSVVSQFAHVCAGTHDYQDSTMPLIRSDIRIGDGAWICADVFVGPGVTVGDGCVVGARSVVVKDLADGTVCAGNPCRVIKARIFKTVDSK